MNTANRVSRISGGKFGQWLPYALIAWLTYALAILVFAVSFQTPWNAIFHLGFAALLVALSYLPLWFRTGVIGSSGHAAGAYIYGCVLLLTVVLYGVYIPDRLIDLYRFPVPPLALALHLVLNSLVTLTFTRLTAANAGAIMNAQRALLPWQEHLETILQRQTIHADPKVLGATYAKRYQS